MLWLAWIGVALASESQDRMDSLRAAQQAKRPYIVVLEKGGVAVDLEDSRVRRLMRMNVARPSALILPPEDLYQAARIYPADGDASDQVARVSDRWIEEAERMAADVRGMPDHGRWDVVAEDLHALVEQCFFIDRVELREPLFTLHALAGKAASLANLDEDTRFFIDGENLHFSAAGRMAEREPHLVDVFEGLRLEETMDHYVSKFDGEEALATTLHFDRRGVFNPAHFASEFVLQVNGLEMLITDPRGLLSLPPGRVDVSLERENGVALSFRLDPERAEGKRFDVRSMGIWAGNALAEQLLSDSIDEEYLQSIAIFQRLHPERDIYLAVWERARKNDKFLHMWIWRPDTATLEAIR